MMHFVKVARRRERFGGYRLLNTTPQRYPRFEFNLKELNVNESSNTLGKSRLGTIVTPHGNVDTPNFVFCATKAAMKAVTMDQIRTEGTQFILSNTYHLMLTPGSSVVKKMGGLQKFTNWRGPMLTDSGGYQIFSMGFGSVSSEIKGKRTVKEDYHSDSSAPKKPAVQTLIKIDETGAIFRSYIDGAIHHLTPEKSISIQRDLGADLIVVLDECTPFNVDKDYTEKSMERSHRWALRSLREFDRGSDDTQALYGIVQGTFLSLYYYVVLFS
jgi:queuine tRNA-ribosyltransferase